MQDADSHGLDRKPPVELEVASLIVFPYGLMPHSRPQCCITDYLITRRYDAAAYMGRIGNSLSHLIFALSQSL